MYHGPTRAEIKSIEESFLGDGLILLFFQKINRCGHCHFLPILDRWVHCSKRLSLVAIEKTSAFEVEENNKTREEKNIEMA